MKPDKVPEEIALFLLFAEIGDGFMEGVGAGRVGTLGREGLFERRELGWSKAVGFKFIWYGKGFGDAVGSAGKGADL